MSMEPETDNVDILPMTAALNPFKPAPRDVGPAVIPGVGPDAPVVTNAAGAKQSGSPYRCDLLPAKSILAVAKVLKYGADRYGPENWRGIPKGDHVNHVLTHLFAWLAGDRSDDHLEHACCRTLMALEAPE